MTIVDSHSANDGIRVAPRCVEHGMDLDVRRPFRGSEAVRRGELTWSRLVGPGFRKLEHDTYVAAEVADSPLLAVRAALVRGGEGAVATGWSACVALGLDVAPRRVPAEIALPERQLTTGVGLVARRQRFAPDEVVVHQGIPVTTPLRTAFDLACRSGPDPMTVDRVIDPLTDAVVAADALARQGSFGAVDLEAFAGRHPGARGVRRVARVVALLDPRPDSPPETRARVKIVLAGLPRPVVRYEVRDVLGMQRKELDLAWPRYRVALEYDGKDHARADRRGNDIDRLDALRREGWLVVVITTPQLARPNWVPDRVREALLERGWTPGPNPWEPLWAENRAANAASMRRPTRRV